MGSIGGGGSPEERAAAGGGPVCVTGSTGYVGSWLVRTLLRRGYRVHATARDPAKAWQVFSAVDEKEQLRVFRADMADEGSFDTAASGCVALFHVAASMDLHVSPDVDNIEEHVRTRALEPATRGTINVLQSCVRAGSVRRVVFTSSISTMTAAAAEDGRWRKAVVDESCLRAAADVWTAKPIGWVYILTKLVTEEAAFGFARENGINLASLVLPTVAGPFLTPAVPTSIQLLLSPVTGDPKLYSLLASVHSRFGCVPLAHIQDVCDAHVFLMENEQADGRYLCAGGSYPMAQIAQLLSLHYSPFKPAERLNKDFHGSNPSVVSSKRLTDLGFRFEHDVDEIIKNSVAQCVDHGFLEDADSSN
ncbi:putative anthocyanidin reductase [Oryza brachyantha]|uniref:putative anthocyanidin reductase n=1 Tax=Oryza brachyantha TaxID=4533 RepID=UPI001ADA09AD|nr:putative anthocyanidin reductase [Oryza brachyantha]